MEVLIRYFWKSPSHSFDHDTSPTIIRRYARRERGFCVFFFTNTKVVGWKDVWWRHLRRRASYRRQRGTAFGPLFHGCLAWYAAAQVAGMRLLGELREELSWRLHVRVAGFGSRLPGGPSGVIFPLRLQLLLDLPASIFDRVCCAFSLSRCLLVSPHPPSPQRKTSPGRCGCPEDTALSGSVEWEWVEAIQKHVPDEAREVAPWQVATTNRIRLSSMEVSCPDRVSRQRGAAGALTGRALDGARTCVPIERLARCNAREERIQCHGGQNTAEGRAAATRRPHGLLAWGCLVRSVGGRVVGRSVYRRAIRAFFARPEACAAGMPRRPCARLDPTRTLRRRCPGRALCRRCPEPRPRQAKCWASPAAPGFQGEPCATGMPSRPCTRSDLRRALHRRCPGRALRRRCPG